MRSEIPQIEVVTAIAAADFDDFVAQLLFSQGWSIIFRAFDSATMEDFLTSRRSLRTVIIYKADLPGFRSDSLMEYEEQPFTFICLDGSEAAAHAIMQKIRSQLRLPLVQNAQRGEVTPSHERSRTAPKVFTVTGSAEAPSRTSLALALGAELSSNSKSGIGVIDADFKSRLLTKRIAEGKSSLSLSPLEASEKPRTLPQLNSHESAIVDLGSFPAIGEAVNDRRWQGNLISSILESTSHLLYVTHSRDESIDELAIFLKEFPILLRKIPITYICIAAGNSRDSRKAEARFLALTTAENRFVIRESQLSGSQGLLGSLTAPKPGKSEIGKIAQSLR